MAKPILFFSKAKEIDNISWRIKNITQRIKYKLKHILVKFATNSSQRYPFFLKSNYFIPSNVKEILAEKAIKKSQKTTLKGENPQKPKNENPKKGKNETLYI